MDKNFVDNFWKGSLKEHFYEIISSYLYSVNGLQPPEPSFLTYQNLANILWKGSHKEHFCEIISKYDQPFQRRRILKNFFMSI